MKFYLRLFLGLLCSPFLRRSRWLLLVLLVRFPDFSYYWLKLTFLGPITVFNYTVYDIIAPRGTPYLAFMCWIGM